MVKPGNPLEIKYTMSHQIGQQLKHVRTQARLTQREMARKAGITNGTISLIEQNKVNPTVFALKKILDVIPMSLSEFFQEEEEGGGEKIFFRESEFLVLSEGDLSIKQVGKNLEGKSMQICYERYAPSASSARDDTERLRHEGQEGGIVIKGHLKITVGKQTAILGPGDAYYFDSLLPHVLTNVGKKELLFVSVISPPTF